MKNISFSLLIFLSTIVLNAQVPQGFNYQAVARDGSGNLITEPFYIKVEIQNLAADTVFWIEEHNVTPNEYGLISFVVGQSGRIGGTATNFSDIDWTSRPRYLKTSANLGSGYSVMGTTQIMSVPYSLVAKEVESPLELEKLGITGTTTEMDEALFEVKNKDGQTIFAVYNEGVRIYVADATKGPKGGFAIGGFGTVKGTSQPYFIVKPDTVRIYINQSGKGVKGGFAIGGYGIDKADPQNFLFVSDDSVRVYIDNADTDLKGVKGGFAIGGYGITKGDQKFLTVSDDSVRIYINDTNEGKSVKGGFAIGGFGTTKGESRNFMNIDIDTTGKIDPSENRILWYPLKNAFRTGKVLIEKKDSVGENSFASGFESKAIGKYSQALGYQAIARGDYSTAIGKNALANNINSFAFGENAIANNNQTYAFGNGSQANALGSIAFGYNAKATGQDAFALGSGTEAIGQGSYAIGFIGRDADDITTGNTKATADWSVAIGMGAQATSKGAFSIGTQTLAENEYSLAMGYKTKASGWYSTAMGQGTKALGQVSTAIGLMTTAGADFSTAIGNYTTASGYGSTAIGYFVTASGAGSTAMGVSTTASGGNSTAMGMNSKAKPYASFVIGRYNDTTCIWSTNWNAADPLFIIGTGSSNTSRKNAMTVMKNGNVGIGLATPTHLLHLTGGAYCDGTGAWVSGSDKSYKKEIKELDKYGIKEIMQLQPVTFVHIQDKTNTVQLGLIAQDVIGIIPELVSGTEGNYGLAYDRISVVLVKAIKEQQQQIESYKSQLQSLQEKVEHIESFLATSGGK